MRKLIEPAEILVANRNAPGGTIDDTGKVQLSQETMERMRANDTMLPAKSSKVPDRKIREMPTTKVSRVIDVQRTTS